MSTTSQSPEESGDEVGVWDADGEGNLIALFVLDEIPVETINMVLAWNYEHSDSKIWPADTYDSLPDYDGIGPMPQIVFPLRSDWRSPFVGKSIPEAVAFMRNVPKPPKPLNTRYCAIMQKDPLDQGCIFICRSLEGEVRSDSQSTNTEQSELEENLDSESEVEGPEGDLDTMFRKRRRLRRNTERRRARAERSLNKTEEQPKRQIEPKHEDDFENVQLIATSSDKVWMFCDGVEHERWPEYFLRWREDQNWIS